MTSVSDEQDVLELAQALWRDRASADLDGIDGAFYWRICQGSLIRRLEELLHAGQEFDGDEFSGPRLFDPQHQAHLGETFDHLFHMNSLIPALDDWLVRRSPRMRDAFLVWPNSVDVPEGEHRAVLRSWRDAHLPLFVVRSGRWTGADVERAWHSAVSELEASNRKAMDQLVMKHQHPASITTSIAFTLLRPQEIQLRSSWGRLPTGDDRWFDLQSSVIVCAAPTGLPPASMVEIAYDELVIRDRGWNSLLLGTETGGRQEIETAIRTWAIGLLQGRGMRFRDAERAVANSLPLQSGGVSESQFTIDRKRLVQRVPEAEEFVYSHRSRRDRPAT